MKKLVLLFITASFIMVSNAQVNQEQTAIALNLVKANARAIGLSENDIKSLLVSGTYETMTGSIRMVYLQQTCKQIPVFNQMQVLAFKDEKLASLSGGRIENIDRFTNTSIPAIMPETAVSAAIKDCKLLFTGTLLQTGEVADKKIFRDISVSAEDIKAQLVWLPVSAKDVRLTWEVEIAPVKSPDHWMIRVDAATGKVLDKNNLTVYEQFPDPVNHLTQRDQAIVSATQVFNSPLVINSATYRVVPYPVESPQHAGGSPSLVTDPWTLASGNATSLKWNYDGTVYHDSTRGNNVWAQEDRDNNDNTFGHTAISSTAQPNLTFDFTPNFTLAPTTLVNQQLATTNLFYWNNIMHDLSYKYGFDEPSGNFQANNQGRGGLGNDYVIADAQDAGGTNNANFATPVDGTRPRMQMYLFTGTTPNRDGDLDDGVISHEYTHGISTRLTGGPANSSCLNNAEQGGEGWSDYFALMAITNWATAQVTDGALAKPMGTYVLGQAVTGPGIRQHPYSTNMSIDPWTYANMAASGGEVHTIGEIWCTALWEMTWEMIQQDGINPNLFNPAATGGNSAALKLVLEGMRLQPCSPGYIDARNAILKADTLFFSARYSCSIWKAFAKRGMGQGASQGSSNSTTDQVASFIANGGVSLLLTQNVSSQQEGQNVTYTNHVNAGVCGSLDNYLLTDTLPSNVSYVSGGTYNSGNRVVSFPVNLASGTSQDYSFTVQINMGSYFPPASLINETVSGTTIPSTWTATTATGTSNWTVSTAQSHSPTRSFFAVDNSAAVTDFRLATNTPIALGAIPPVFTFWHYYNMEAGWDGGVVEISTNGGTTWSDLGANMTTNGYNGSVGGTNPIAGRSAFTGNSGGFVQTKISLLPYANQNALFRFRATSDDNTAATGWYVDDIIMNTLAVVNMRSSLFNSTNSRLTTSDTFTLIQQRSCIAGAISTQPANTTVCANGNVSFSITATGTSLSYQWQFSTDGGSTYANLNGETNATLVLSAVTTSMNNYQYRCQISGTCTTLTNSNAATLTVNAAPAAPSGSGAARCNPGTVTVSAAGGANETIDWYAASTGGSALLTGSNNFTTAAIASTTLYYAEARNTTTGCISAGRTAVVATINTTPANAVGVPASRCGTGTVTISATTGTGETLDWYAASAGGSALLIGSATFTTPSINTTTTYYAESRNSTTGCISAGRTAVTATVNTIPSSPSGTGDLGCGATSLTLYAAPGTGETVDWYAAAAGGSPLLSGSTSYSTPVISSTTVYFAQSINSTTGCSSASRTAVTATIGNTTNSTTHISICATALPYLWNNNSFDAGGVYTVTLVNASGCDSLAKLLLDVGAAINIQTVTGGGTYTAGGAGVPVGLNGSETGVNYQLLLTGNPVGNPVAGNNSAISFGNQIQPGTYTVFATTALCAATMSGSTTVVINSGPPVQFMVTGGGTYCAGGNGLAVGLAGSETDVNYQLQRSNGSINVGSPVAGTGSAISFGLQTIASDYSVLATNTVSLATEPMLNSVNIRIASVTRAPSAPGAITGPPDACPYLGGSNVTYTIQQAANATSYLWTAPSGANIIGSNTDTIVVIQYPASFVSGTLSVVSVNACFANATSSARSLAITRKIPATPGTITASLINPCSIVGTSATSAYTVRKVTYATGYTWTLPPGITLISNSGDTGIIVRFQSGFTTGSISVVAYNNCSTSAARALTVTATHPSTPAAISGPVNVCAFIGQGTTAAFSIAAVSGAGSYQWITPANATVVSGQGTTSVQVSFAASFNSGNLTVSAVSGCGNSSARSLTLVKNIAKPGAISASAPACPSATVTYTIAAVPYATSYIWSVPTNAIYVSGQGSTSFTVSYKPAFVSGTVTVKSVNNCSTSAVSSLAVNASQCSPPPFAGSKNTIITAEQEEGISIYPNPGSGIFKVKDHVLENNNNVIIQLVDIYGNLLLQQNAPVDKSGNVSSTINAQHIMAGIYEVRCINGRSQHAKKLVIIK